ncbi:hypothetical protein [Plesiomonas sp.]|uniref:hypothetical protein n=1 Tax=Plesiomonas sp. TaxID=2486279 RepID=UPI003F37D188
MSSMLLCSMPARAVFLSDQSKISLAGQLHFLPDPQERYTPEQIQQPALQQKFTQLKCMPDFGYQ